MKQFKWTDELAYEFAAKWKDGRLGDRLPIAIEEFKQSKQPKPEWKVISLQTENYTFNLHLNSMYKSGDVEFSLEHLLNVEKAQITTVQRLSDGEIFSVGDKVSSNSNDCILKLNEYSILSFLKDADKMWAELKEDVFILVESLISPQQPLFTTEDGVPVYEGERFWYVDNDFKCNSLIGYRNLEKHISWKVFFTETAAEKYVLENKPQLSLSDVEQAYVGDKKSKEYISLIDNLRLIIRQKK